MTERNPNWGGRRSNAGRPRKYVRIPKKSHTERSERELLTPQSDLTICVAEMDVDENEMRRGIMIGDIWYGYEEALSIADFVKRYRRWLGGSPDHKRYYTYTYEYPQDYPDEQLAGTVFYVGKGTDNRIDAHEEEARRGEQSPKCDVIRQIWDAGYEVVKRKRHEGVSEDDAFVLEARLIQQYGLANVTNIRPSAGSVGHSTSPEHRELIAYTKQLVKERFGIDLDAHKQEIDE